MHRPRGEFIFRTLRGTLSFHVTLMAQQPKGRCVWGLKPRSRSVGSCFVEKSVRRFVPPIRWDFLAPLAGGLNTYHQVPPAVRRICLPLYYHYYHCVNSGCQHSVSTFGVKVRCHYWVSTFGVNIRCQYSVSTMEHVCVWHAGCSRQRPLVPPWVCTIVQIQI